MAKAPNLAFMKPHDLTPELEAVVGKGPLPRPEITSKLWVYIKAHKLQKPGAGRIIVPDATLAKVMGSAEIDMLKMGGKISAHLKN